MAISTNLPSHNVTLRFPGESLEENYQLLELPSEILKQIEGKSESFPLTIKGRPSDDAVLCTPSSTYLIRTVGISNSILVCRPPKSKVHELEIRDTSHEILELVPQPPNLERIRTLLRPTAWKGVGHGLGDVSRKRKRVERGWTKVQMESVIQASDGELKEGLRERNVIDVGGRLIMFPPATLGPLLSIIFNLLAIHSTTPLSSVSSGTARSLARPIMTALEEHDVPPEISSAVMRLFSARKGGNMSDDRGEIDVEWMADTRGMVKQVGLGLLEGIKGQKRLDQFEEEWRSGISDWEGLADITLLDGNYLLNDPPPSALAHPSPNITYFPAHTLPLVPAIRFADLFLTRTPWKPDEMAPFLRGLYREGDTKERDKLVAKFVRVVKDKKGTWWYPRRSS